MKYAIGILFGAFVGYFFTSEMASGDIGGMLVGGILAGLTFLSVLTIWD